jgi:hypothetical protein
VTRDSEALFTAVQHRPAGLAWIRGLRLADESLDAVVIHSLHKQVDRRRVR